LSLAPPKLVELKMQKFVAQLNKLWLSSATKLWPTFQLTGDDKSLSLDTHRLALANNHHHHPKVIMRLFQVIFCFLALIGYTACSQPGCTTPLLNSTRPYEVLLLGSAANSSTSLPSSNFDLNVTGSLVCGSVAVNGNTFLLNSFLGEALNCSGAEATLLVTGNLNSTSSMISCGPTGLQKGSNISTCSGVTPG